jgi:hypothetical protein
MQLLLYWGRTEGKETPQRMLNLGTQILPILLMGGGSKGNNWIATSRTTTTDPTRQGISTSTQAQAPCLNYGCFTIPSTRRE